MLPRALPIALLVVPLACRAASVDGATGVVEATSVDGRELLRPPLARDEQAEREAALEQARDAARRAPDDATAQVWVGRRLAYLGRFREAAAAFEAGAARFPLDPRFPRHAGHRLITLRRFAQAQSALQRAEALMAGWSDEIEPNGLPSASGAQVDWLAHSIHYHLGLARYFQGDWRGASDAFGACLAVSRNDDARCSAAYWLVLALRRQGRDEAARRVLEELGGELEVAEYRAYRDLIEHYAGRLDESGLLAPGRAAGGVDFATRAYGAAVKHLLEGRREAGLALLREIVEAGTWPAFGAIGAEVELASGR
jgi:tetratricopeptide (TPR) repeat protein